MPALRVRAIQLSRDGVENSSIARELQVARSSVIRWLNRHREHGDEVLNRPLGRPRRLSDEERARVASELLRGPEAHGFPTPLWTLPRIAEVICRLTGVSYAPAYLSRLLAGMGWSCQKPERRAKERDEEAIAHWKDAQWPQIKKKQKTWAPR